MSTLYSSRRALIRALPAILAFALCSLPAGAQEPLLSVRAATPHPLTAKGRESLSFALFVDNAAAVERTVLLETVLPAGWKMLVTPEPFTIAAGDSAVRIVGLLVPTLAPAGSYLIGCRVTDQGDPGTVASCQVGVEVAPAPALRIEVSARRDFAIAGTSYEVSFNLVNSGNADLRFALDVSGSYFPCDLSGIDDPGSVELPVGASRGVTVAVRTSTALPGAIENTVSVVARQPPLASRNPADLPGPVTAMVTTEVIPLGSSGGSLMHHLPVATETTATLDGDGVLRGSVAETITAKGTLDEAGRHALEVKVRKVLATEEDLLLNPEDRYSLAYRYGFAELLLLDQGFSVSPLLASGENGRGAQIKLSPGLLRINALYFRDVWAPGQPQGIGGGLGIAIRGSGSAEKPLYRADLGIFSNLAGTTGIDLWQRFEPGAWLGMQLDAALQFDAAGDLVPALLVEAKGTLAGSSYEARFLRAWPDFDGPYRDTQSIGASAAMRLLDDLLSIRGSLSLTDNNLFLDPGLLTATRTFQFAIGASAKVPSLDAEATLGWTTFRRTDLLLPPGNGSFETIARLGWKQDIGVLVLEAGAALDGWVDLGGGTSYLDQTDSVSLAWQHSPRDRYGLTLEYAGRWSATSVDRHEPGVGASAEFSWERTSLKLSAHAGIVLAETGWQGAGARADAAFRHLFPWGHSLAATAGASYQTEAGVPSTGFSLSLSYGVPLSVPVSRRSDTAIVRGTVIRVESGIPVLGVILRLNGLAAVSGKRGEFTFYLPKSGTHYLQLDRGSLGRGLIPSTAFPLEVVSPPGSDTALNITLVEGGTVTGNVTLYGFPEQTQAFSTTSDAVEPEQQKMGGLANVVIELSGNGEQKRRVTGADGRFTFEEVVPGSYTLEVVGGRIPGYYTVEQPSRTLLVPAAGREEVEFRVLQDRRTVHFIEYDITLVAEESARLPSEITLPKKVPNTTTATDTTATTTDTATTDTTAATDTTTTTDTTDTTATTDTTTTTTDTAATDIYIPPAPGARHVAPDVPSRESLVMAAQAAFDAPEPTWEELLAAERPGLPEPCDPPVVAVVTSPTTDSTITVAEAATTTSTTTTSTTTPTTTPTPTPTPTTTPTITVATVSIPLPMPTPRPPVIIPTPQPTPRPFVP